MCASWPLHLTFFSNCILRLFAIGLARPAIPYLSDSIIWVSHHIFSSQCRRILFSASWENSAFTDGYPSVRRSSSCFNNLLEWFFYPRVSNICDCRVISLSRNLSLSSISFFECSTRFPWSLLPISSGIISITLVFCPLLPGTDSLSLQLTISAHNWFYFYPEYLYDYHKLQPNDDYYSGIYVSSSQIW